MWAGYLARLSSGCVLRGGSQTAATATASRTPLPTGPAPSTALAPEPWALLLCWRMAQASKLKEVLVAGWVNSVDSAKQAVYSMSGHSTNTQGLLLCCS